MLLVRKTGIELARGKYSLFLDGDDSLCDDEALERVVRMATQTPADMVGFDIEVVGGTENQRKNVRTWVQTKGEEKTSQAITGSMFSANFKYGWNIWNKVYKTDVLKKSYPYIPNIRLICAEDALLSFIFSVHAENFKNYVPLDNTQPLPIYKYRLGGISTSIINPNKFIEYAREIQVPELLKDFLEKKELKENSFYISCLKTLKKRLLFTNFWRLVSLPNRYQPKAFKMLWENGSPTDIATLSPAFFKTDEQIMSYAKMSGQSHAKSIKKSQHIKTIGIFYHRYFEGGVERVISLQIPVFLKMGLKVVLITEKIDCGKEFPLSESVTRVILPPTFEAGRASILKQAIENLSIDLVIYHAASSRNIIFDLQILKTTAAHVVVQRHELTTQDFSRGETASVKNISSFPYAYSLADLLIVLSHMEEEFYRSLGINAKYIPNPVSPELFELPRWEPEEKGVVLWVGRLDYYQKGVKEALEIMRQIIEHRPETKCIMVGPEYSPGSREFVESFISKHKLTGKLVYAGSQSNPYPFYVHASVQLCTSTYESFPMVLLESRMIGVPLVTYDMPYLELLKSGKGFISVSQHDMISAANEVCRLLENPKELQQMSREAQKSGEEFASFDYAAEWKNIFSQFCQPDSENDKLWAQGANARMFFDTACFFIGEGIKRKEETVDSQIMNSLNQWKQTAKVYKHPFRVLKYRFMAKFAFKHKKRCHYKKLLQFPN